MKIKKLVKLILLIICLMGLLPFGEASAEKTIEWKHASRTRETGFVNVLIKWYYNEVEKRTNGQFKVKYYWNGTLVNTENLPDGLKAGISQSTLFAPVMYQAKMPLLNITCLPFMNPRDRKKAAILHTEFIKHPAIKKEFDRWDAMLLAPNSFGQEQFVGSKPIRTTQDMKGMRISAHSVHSELLKSFGAVNVIIPSTEAYDALQKGIIDGCMSSDGMFNAFRMYEISKYATRFNITGMVTDFVCKKSAFNKLPSDIQQVFNDVSKEALVYFPEQWDEFTEKAVDTYKKNGLEVIELSSEEYAKLQKAAEEFEWKKWLDQYEKQGLPAREVMDFYLAKKKEIAPE